MVVPNRWYVQCMQAPSCMFTLSPMRIKFTSPRTTVLNQIEQSFPITTSPTTVAFGAMKQLSPNCGYLFSTGSITGIDMFLIDRFYFVYQPTISVQLWL